MPATTVYVLQVEHENIVYDSDTNEESSEYYYVPTGFVYDEEVAKKWLAADDLTRSYVAVNLLEG